MFREIPDLLSAADVAALREIAARARFVDGRISNPHSQVKNNLQLHEPSAFQRSAEIVLKAMRTHEDFTNFAIPAMIAPPLLTRYEPGMRYGAHFDTAYMQSAAGPLRADVSCTIFLSDPADYSGGALCVRSGTRATRFRGPPGSAVLYPSDTVHEVEPVTAGARLVAITFVQSRIPDPFRRELVYELGEVSALGGNAMGPDNLMRLQRVQQNLMRYWGERP